MTRYSFDNVSSPDEDEDEISGKRAPRGMKQSGKGRMGPAGNAISPPEGRAYSGGQAKGDKSTGKGFGQTYSRPGEQPYSNKAYSGGQSRGATGFSSPKKWEGP